MFFPVFRNHDVGRLFAPVEAIFEERTKHPVLLVDAVKESTNVTLPAEIASGELYGLTSSHISPHTYADIRTGISDLDLSAFSSPCLRACEPAVAPLSRGGTGQVERRTGSPAATH